MVAEADSRAKSLNYLDQTTNLEHDPQHAYELQANPKACSPTYLVKECGCGRIAVQKTCMNLDCVVCQPKTTRRRARQAFLRLSLARRPVIYTVFTIPFMERYRFIDKAVWQKVRSKVWKILRQYFGAEFGVEATHPIGDESNEFHPHLNFLWIQKDGYSPFIDVDMLREKWSALLGVSVADVNTQYSESQPKIRHMCNYALRTFPGYMWWCGSVRWYGHYPKLEKPTQEICPECGKPFHCIGSISHIDIDDWNSGAYLSGTSPPWMDDSKIVKFKNSKKDERRT
jgi:hypothetical protein